MVGMPETFTFPSMLLFDGTTNPNDHIAHYKQRMFIVSIPRAQREACMCKGFESILAGRALQWYTSLPNTSNGSFVDLHAAFVEQCTSSRKVEKHSDDLYTIRQRDIESLRALVSRFNREKISIPGCNLDTAIAAFRKGLKTNSDLYKEFTKYPCRMMENVLNKVWAHIK